MVLVDMLSWPGPLGSEQNTRHLYTGLGVNQSDYYYHLVKTACHHSNRQEELTCVMHI